MIRGEAALAGGSRTKEMVLFGLFTALIAIGAFIKIPVPVCPFTLQLLFTTLAGLYPGEPKRGLLGGAICASGARWGAGLYGGRRSFVYFPADVWIPHRVHRGCMADGLDLREERGLLFR